MRSLKCGVGIMLVILVTSNSSAISQDRSDTYKPRLSDMMAAIQVRHSKLWYAGSLLNWPLAEYELEQLDASLEEVARLYPDMPGEGLAETRRLMTVVGETVKAASVEQFEAAFTELTDRCNSCHVAADRPFINIRKPTYPSPYSNQLFAPEQ
ncbi:hypothetical protein [Arvimicrobium flavum]|uniref:hypothetical protein n=1 Tax=Arvimicrobium flavum TaxID=3393320 RepID=UPI00237A5E38|nr:hypothetical protein [Mesorhizobium shangrilense]